MEWLAKMMIIEDCHYMQSVYVFDRLVHIHILASSKFRDEEVNMS